MLQSLALRGISAFDALVDLTRKTNEEDPVVRRAAVAGVSRMNMEAVPDVLERVIREDPDVSVQVTATQGVALLANPGLVIPRAQISPHPEVRITLIEALAKRKDVSSYTSTIAEMLADENDAVVRHAVLLLDQYYPSDLTDLRSASRSNEDRVLGMVRSVVAGGTTAEKVSALRFLGQAQLSAGWPLCVEALVNKHKSVRVVASFALATFAEKGSRSPRVVLPVLLNAASDRNKSVRYNVTIALARHIESFTTGERVLSPELRQAEDFLCRMTRDRNAEVRTRAIENISVVFPHDASFFINRALIDRAPVVRRAALAYACRKPGLVSKGLLYTNLSHADPAVRRQAARALFRCEEPGDRERLLQIAANPWSRRRAGAILFVGYCAGDDPGASSRIAGILAGEETWRATLRRFALGFLGLLGPNWPSPIGACFEALLLAQDKALRSKVEEYADHGGVLFRMLARQVLDQDK